MATNFTFRKQPKVGRYKSFDRDATNIKLAGKICGTIFEMGGYNCSEEDRGKYKIGFMVIRDKTTEDPTPFKWIWFKKRFGTEEEARVFVNAESESIQKRYQLYLLED